MINAGAFRHKILIYSAEVGKDSAGFATPERNLILSAHAQVKTVRGYTIIVNNSDFEKAYTNFTIRRPAILIKRNMIIKFAGKKYDIQYINPLGIAGELLEMQGKEVQK